MSTPERLLNRPHAVYYIYGPDHALLYIGRSVRPQARLSALRRENSQTWGQYIIDFRVRWFADFSQARTAEAAALRRHRPLCNPVIPEVDGRHVTFAGGRPSKSTWRQLQECGLTAREILDTWQKSRPGQGVGGGRKRKEAS